MIDSPHSGANFLATLLAVCGLTDSGWAATLYKYKRNTKELYCPYFGKDMEIRLLVRSVHITNIVYDGRDKTV